MVSMPRTIGAMETYEPEDKSFSKHIINEGTGDTTPNEGSQCVVSFRFVDPIELDEGELGQYVDGEEKEVTIGEGDTILSELIDTVVMSMKEGEASYCKTKVDKHGKKLDEATLKQTSIKFNVILKSFNRCAEGPDLEDDERLERAQHNKDMGTELFKQSRLDFSIKRYQRAVRMLEDIAPDAKLPGTLEEQFRTLRIHCFLNLGACFLKKDDYTKVIENCSSAIALDDNNVKGRFRRSQAYMKLNQYAEAKDDLDVVLSVEPDNKAAKNSLLTLDQMVKKEKDTYKKMFAGK